LTNYAAVYAAPMAVGHALGAAAVGLYNRAFQLVAFPLSQLAGPLTRVVVPNLAHVEEGPKLVAAAKRAQLAMAYALLPLLAFIIVGGEDLIEILFGQDWRPSGRIAQILAVGGVFQILGYVNYWLFTRKGRLGLLWMIEGSVWIPLIALYFVFSDRGAAWIAALYAASLATNWLMSSSLGLRLLGLPAMELIRPSLRRLMFLIPIVAAGLITRMTLAHNGWHAISALAVATLSCLLAVAALAIIPAFRQELREFGRALGNVRKRAS
jgi:PST family polysaccharide transporter